MAERKARIDSTHARSISRQAQLAGISRGSVYYAPTPVGAADLVRRRRLDAVHLEHPFMGARLLRDQLTREGGTVGRTHVGTRMARRGIEALYRKPGTSTKHPGHDMYPSLLRGRTIKRANQVWALDTTYIPMAKGFVYPHRRRGRGQPQRLSFKGCHHAGALSCG
jgi:putative transposase